MLALALLALTSLSACTKSLPFTEPVDETPLGPPQWRGPRAMDLGTLSADYLPSTGDSYFDFELRGMGDRAALVMSAPFQGRNRVFARTFFEDRRSGGGWSHEASAFTIIDRAGGSTSYDFGGIAAAFTPGGDLLAAFTGCSGFLCAGGGSSDSALLASGAESWTRFTGVLSGTGGPLNFGYWELGEMSSLHWDSSGTAWWASVGSASPWVGKVHRYTLTTGWSSPSEHIRLGAYALQIATISDGTRNTAVWMSQYANKSLSISLGEDHSCVATNGDVRCWGRNHAGQLGVGASASASSDPDSYRSVPTAVQGELGEAVQVVTGKSHTCALDADSRVWCWGDNTFGQLGVDPVTVLRSNEPVLITALTDPVRQLAAGDNHTCALDSNELWCWGANSQGQLGRGSSSAPDFNPARVVGVGGAGFLSIDGSSEIAAGMAHTCAILANDVTVACWGLNNILQMGSVIAGGDGIPRLITLPGGYVAVDFTRISSRGNSTCVTDDLNAGVSNDPNYVLCWGANSFGQLGFLTTSASELPNIPIISGIGFAIRAYVGGEHTCFLLTDSTLFCHGRNQSGELGDNQASGTDCSGQYCSVDGVWLAQISGVVEVAMGRNHTCVVDGSATRLQCWGENEWGQVGKGVIGDSSDQKIPLGIEAGICLTNNCLFAADLDDRSRVRPRVLSTSDSDDDVYNFSLATDGNGALVVAFMQEAPASNGNTPKYIRPYAAERNSLGQWTATHRLDLQMEDVDRRQFHQTSPAGARKVPPIKLALTEPGTITAVMGVRFEDVHVRNLFARQYSVTDGWSDDLEFLHATNAGGTTDAQAYHSFSLSADGEGNLLVVGQALMDRTNESTLSAGQYRLAPFVAMLNTRTMELVGDLNYLPDYWCDADDTECGQMPPPQGHLFPNGEKLMIFGAPKTTGSLNPGTEMRLYSLEYY